MSQGHVTETDQSVFIIGLHKVEFWVINWETECVSQTDNILSSHLFEGPCGIWDEEMAYL